MTIPISFSARVLVPEGVLRQVLDGESVILNVESGRYFGLDAVGSRMWDVVVAADSIEQGCAALTLEYDVPAVQLRNDLEKWLGELLDYGLLTVEGE